MKNAVISAIDVILGGVSTFLGAMGDALNIATKIPGIGHKFDGLRDSVRGAARRVNGLREELRELKSPKPIRCRAGEVPGPGLRGISGPSLTRTFRHGTAGGP